MKRLKNLSEPQRQALGELVKSGITEGFYLAGGTAIFLKYAHRPSEDFDFFSFPERNFDFFKLIRKLPSESLKVEELKHDTLIFLLNGVKCSFFEYPYPVLKSPDKFADLGIYIASDEDIAAMKAIAIIQRGSKKDFYDLWYLMKRHSWNMEKLKEFCHRKYGKLFSETSLERAMIYFEDAEKEKFPHVEQHWEEIKAFFTSQTAAILKDTSQPRKRNIKKDGLQP